MRQHHRGGCAIRCGISAPAQQAAAIRETTLIPAAPGLPAPALALRSFEQAAMIDLFRTAPPPTPPPL